MLYAGIPPDKNREPATAPASRITVLTFEDGLGWRYRVQAGVDLDAQQEILCFRSELTNIPSFEFALRERVAALSSFQHTCFTPIRSVARLKGELASLALISEFTPGVRLAEMLTAVEQRSVVLDADTALYIVRRVLSAVTSFHQSVHVAHGAIGLERVIITANARVFIAEFALGPALEQLRYSRDRYWRELRVALPLSAGFAEFNEYADVTQVGAIALSLILGRPLRDDEYPAELEDLVGSACSRARNGESKPLTAGLRDWLRRTLQLDARNSFRSPLAAQAALNELLTAKGTHTADAAALTAFLGRYHKSSEMPASPSVPSWTPLGVRTPVSARSQLLTEMPFISDEVEEGPVIAAASKTMRRRRAPIVAGLVLTAAAGILFAGQRYFSRPSVSVRAMGTLVVDTNPQGALVFIDGQARGQTPAHLSLDPGLHTLVIQADADTRTVPVTIAAGATASQYLELPKAKELTPGEHVVTIDSDLGPVSHAVKREAGASASPVVPHAAKGAPATGWMSISVPVDLYLYERGRLLGSSGIDRIMLPAGKHDIEMVNEELGYRARRTVNVSPGKTLTVSVDLPKGLVSLNATPWASIWIGGRNVGDTPIGNLSVPIGTHEVVFRNPQLGEQRRAVTVTLHAPARLSVDLTKK